MNPQVARWSATVGQCDGLVVVTPEYEWADKAVGLVGYAGQGGVRAVEHLRSVCGQLKLADVWTQSGLSFAADFDEQDGCNSGESQFGLGHKMIAEVIASAAALKPLRVRKFGVLGADAPPSLAPMSTRGEQ
ncbi:NAD(P)H-dependent FMN reductase [Prauserella isguenensis]|uniref:NAD(P)H-dependent FMN reductase n=1 Tax=Prauserella isguenensis TaxID=1470180 RepID=A0A839S5K7_9PSEU|nr:hypothetical protein [Prauserella isguenensis]MBB3053125.1 NAD(P)H-dependent FMN reductase [Prauserella isguenensis]